jgi:hypothetical protein
MNTSIGRSRTRLFQHPQLRVVVHHNGQPVLRDLRELVRREKPLQQQDATRVSSVAQADRGIELDEGQAVGAIQRGEHLLETVAVRVGFHDSEHLRLGRQLAHAGEIGAQRGKAHLSVERTGHRSL